MHRNYQNQQNIAEGRKVKVTAPVVEEPKAPEKKDVFGAVTGCSSLLVREKPNKDADIVTALPAGTELMIDRENSTPGYYKVCNAAGIEGFCMRQYVELKV